MRQLLFAILLITNACSTSSTASQQTADELNQASATNIQDNLATKCNYLAGPPDAKIIHATGAGVISAWYGKQTDIYAHGVLGDAIEAQSLYVNISASVPATNDPATDPNNGSNNGSNNGQAKDTCALNLTLDALSVFEDVNPRIADVTGDGINDVITIESHRDKGASLAIYGVENGQLQKLATTPYIGQAYRWLAPVGMADFNGDGTKDVAFVQTPHLGGILQIWSFRDKRPQRLAASAGFSNHKIGENFITGGIAHCDGQPVIVIPDRQWESTQRSVFTNGTIRSTKYAGDTSRETIQQALNCK